MTMNMTAVDTYYIVYTTEHGVEPHLFTTAEKADAHAEHIENLAAYRPCVVRMTEVMFDTDTLLDADEQRIKLVVAPDAHLDDMGG
jgi:hypothetical protein